MDIRRLFGSHGHNLRRVGQEHPLETFWLAVFALALLFIPNNRLGENDLLVYWLPFLPYFAVLYRLRGRAAWYRAAGVLPVIGSAALYLAMRHEHLHSLVFTKLAILNVLAFLALLFDWSLRPNRAFLSRAVLTVANVVSALLVSGCLMLALGLIDGALRLLFDLEISNGNGSKIYYVPLFALTPLMFLSFERPWQRERGEPVLLQNRVIEISLNYIAVPMLWVFTALIYAYTAKIIWQGELPRGGVAVLVCTYLAAGLFTQMLQELSCASKWQRFHRWFPLLTLLPLGLLWTGIIERIGSYGLTQQRIWLLAIALLLTAYCLLSLRPLWRQYRAFAAMLLATGFLVGILLPLKSMADASQQRHFERQLAKLNLLDPQGKIVQPLPPAATEGQAAQDWKRLMEQSLYIGLSNEEAEERYGAGYAELINRRTDAGSNPFAEEYSERRFHLNNQSLPLADGSRIRPLSYASRQYGGEEGSPLIGFDLNDDGERVATLPPPRQFIAETFARHGLDPKRAYLKEELDVLADDLLRIPLPDGRILLAEQVTLRFDEEEGYLIFEIHPFALLIPAGFQELPAAFQPAASETDAEVSAAATAASAETAASAAEAAVKATEEAKQ